MIKKIGATLASHRKEKHYSQHDVAAMLIPYGINVSNAAVSAWEKDTTIPNAHQFLALCKILEITEIYEAFIGTSETKQLAKLNDKGKEMVSEYISLLLLSDKYRALEAPLIPFSRKIKFSTLATSAGTGDFMDEENFELIDVGNEVPLEADFGVSLNGDSMEPKYHDNQAVWVQQANTLSNGDIGIFYLDGMTYCKQLKNDKDGLFLISLNSKYQPIEITTESDFRVFGRVLN